MDHQHLSTLLWREQELLEGVLNALPLPDGAEVSIAFGDARSVAEHPEQHGWPSAADVAIVDARTDLAAARGLCRLLGTTGTSVPVVAVVNEGGLVAVGIQAAERLAGLIKVALHRRRVLFGSSRAPRHGDNSARNSDSPSVSSSSSASSSNV